MMLVPAGDPVDSVIKNLLPHLDKGDLLITVILATATSKDTGGRSRNLRLEGIQTLRERYWRSL
jgi:6-phosphogluconate dehydrogenase